MSPLDLPPDYEPGRCALCQKKTPRADFIVCLLCMASWDDDTTDQFIRARKTLARWVESTHDFLETLPSDSPERLRGEATWRKRLKTYEMLCCIVPEVEGVDYASRASGAAERNWRELEPGGAADQAAAAWRANEEARVATARARWEQTA